MALNAMLNAKLVPAVCAGLLVRLPVVSSSALCGSLFPCLILYSYLQVLCHHLGPLGFNTHNTVLTWAIQPRTAAQISLFTAIY